MRPYQRESARAARPASACLHAGSVGLRPPGRLRDGERAVREAPAGADRRAVRREVRPRPVAAHHRTARPRRPAAAALERSHAVAIERPGPSADGVRRLQPDVCGVQASARPRHRVGHGRRRQPGRIGWWCGHSAFVVETRATAARAATSRSATSTPARIPRASPCRRA